MSIPNFSTLAGQQSQSKAKPKALRFVTNYGAPHPKRRRIGAACLTCRKRKTACSGERPFCETCKQNKLECVGYSPENAAGLTQKNSPPESNERSEPDQKEPVKAQDVSRKPETTHYQPPARTGNRQEDAHMRAETKAKLKRSNQELSDLPLFSGPRNRMPYFRWLGPTAIMPGFKQMVVKVKHSDSDVAKSSTDGMPSPSAAHLNASAQTQSYPLGTPGSVDHEARPALNLPFYDTSPMPPSELITHLANTFFTHLGCNYPFLQRERFLRDLEEKQVDAILVDAVCALASRFSTHSILKQQTSNNGSQTSPADYGHAFAVRAKAALTDTFACPSVAAVQAALLLAYNEFGESRDSGLWMYLGIAIRMAQDLGMHKLEGLRFKGRDGPTPRAVARAFGGEVLSVPTFDSKSTIPTGEQVNDLSTDEQKAVEQERIDTFWAIFFLDRVVSSGTGRTSTLRDKEIELSFPRLDAKDPKTGWPAPFPSLIRIIHLYGRVADLLNGIKEPSDINPETSKRLGAMENQVTHFYQGLSHRLHFDAVNFQHYMKAGEGTNFVLLHFWFHTLIVLLHRPTLLKTFEGHMLQLFPNSQQLSMSSAKTIADILSYSQLMDAKASLGNPFTSQPIYIAACAFLKETAEQTATSNAQSRSSSPTRHLAAEPVATSTGTSSPVKRMSASDTSSTKKTPVAVLEQKALAKHTLLATAANQHYQLCYKALQSLETYWSGAKYILTVLDQKFEGVGDPLLYTVEEGESALERPRPEPEFTSPGWRRKLSWGQSSNPGHLFRPRNLGQVSGMLDVDPSKAIGWTLTGTTNSPSTNLVWHYPSGAGMSSSGDTLPPPQTKRSNTFDIDSAMSQAQAYNPSHSGTFAHQFRGNGANSQIGSPSEPNIPHSNSNVPRSSSTASTRDAGLLLGLNANYQASRANAVPFSRVDSPNGSDFVLSDYNHLMGFPMSGIPFSGPLNMHNLGDMEIAPMNDVDMSALGLDMMPWFDPYSTQEMLDSGIFNSRVDSGGALMGPPSAATAPAGSNPVDGYDGGLDNA